MFVAQVHSRFGHLYTSTDGVGAEVRFGCMERMLHRRTFFSVTALESKVEGPIRPAAHFGRGLGTRWDEARPPPLGERPPPPHRISAHRRSSAPGKEQPRRPAVLAPRERGTQFWPSGSVANRAFEEPRLRSTAAVFPATRFCSSVRPDLTPDAAVYDVRSSAGDPLLSAAAAALLLAQGVGALLLLPVARGAGVDAAAAAAAVVVPPLAGRGPSPPAPARPLRHPHAADGARRAGAVGAARRALLAAREVRARAVADGRLRRLKAQPQGGARSDRAKRFH